jgi:intraflagellar transport protein 88
VTSWLGAYYIECEMFEQAIPYFQKSALLEPYDTKWSLTLATCYKKCGAYQISLDLLKSLSQRNPESAECTSTFIDRRLKSPYRDLH